MKSKGRRIKEILERGIKAEGQKLKIYCLHDDSSEMAVYVIIKKKLGNAIKRNRAKRVLKEIWRKQREKMKKPFDIIIIPKVDISANKFRKTEEDLISLMGYMEKT